METNLLETSKKILNVLFIADVVMLLAKMFLFDNMPCIIPIIVNLVLLGSYLVIQKYHMVFTLLIQSGKMAKSLNGALNKYG